MDLSLDITLSLALPAAAKERVVCTVAVEAGSSVPLVHNGSCDERISAASTFKIAISLMAFDSGIFVAPDKPEWPFKEGYADWNPKWRQATTPASWMRDSVVWFSQRATERLGTERFAAYVDAFDYGNQDVSGDKGKANGLTNAWLSSSLQISPAEQVAFLRRMIDGELPIDPSAVEQTKKLLVFDEQPGGWRIYGKTGAGMPFGEDGELLKGQPFGWYVGWAEKDERKVVFARLVRFSERPETTPAMIARAGLLEALFRARGALN
ncbi:class D beta-lactamase [Paracoccus onubensis]|uniref:class D beta-lactamase n=1 Tax=Paracoccus onubensis TaxID=1675788 RepID=UPI0016042952|nr:class D beta-lactamase [Paracoccus onubensis]